MPIYNTFLIFMNIFCGAVFLNEYKMYSVGEMFYLVLCLAISVCGIIMLVRKPDLKSCFKSAARKTEESSTVEENSINKLSIDGLQGEENNYHSYD